MQPPPHELRAEAFDADAGRVRWRTPALRGWVHAPGIARGAPMLADADVLFVKRSSTTASSSNASRGAKRRCARG